MTCARSRRPSAIAACRPCACAWSDWPGTPRRRRAVDGSGPRSVPTSAATRFVGVRRSGESSPPSEFEFIRDRFIREGNGKMAFVTTQDDVEIFYKDWGPKDARPIMFHHGWPLCADDWDAQMLFFLQKGYRVIAHDRRGHGRSSQVSAGPSMDHYA